jgi:hypothetical protein
MPASTDQLWGGLIRSVSLSADLATVELTVVVLESGTESIHSLRMDAVLNISFQRRLPLPWEYAEMTAIDVVRTAEGVRVEMDLWSTENRMVVVCGSVTLDGTELGNGMP